MLCTAVLLLLCAGTALAEPDIILVQDENYEVVQYRVSDVQASQVLAADLFDKMSFAFENGYQVLGITSQRAGTD